MCTSSIRVILAALVAVCVAGLPAGGAGETVPATGGTAPGVLAVALLAAALLTGVRARSSRAA